MLDNTHTYFTITPNIIDDILIDPYEYRVYAKIKRMANTQGKCWPSKSTLAKQCGMSLNKLKSILKALEKPRPELNGKALIKEVKRFNKQKKIHESSIYQIVDIWTENMEQVKKQPICHEVTGGGSPDAQGVGHQMTQGGSPDGYKEEPIEEEPIKEDSRNCVAPSEHASRLSLLLFSLIKENDPKAKPPNYEKWNLEIDRMHRIDKRSYGEIEALIRFAQQHDFWQTNILSPAKLRKQATKLTLQMQKSKSKEAEQKKELQDYSASKEYVHQWAMKAPGSILMQAERVQIKINGYKEPIYYNDPSFKEQFDNAIRKLGVR
jgi:hypothetical protein